MIHGQGRRRATAVLLLLLLAGCASIVPDLQEVPQPVAAPEVGRVVLFTGLNWFGESYRGTGTDALAQQLRGAGVPAAVYRPGEWERAAAEILRLAPRPAAIAVYGYSAGGTAAARFAGRLGEAGVPVETLLLLEAWSAAAVPCSVRYAVQYRLEPGNPITPAAPGCTQVANEVIEVDRAGRASPLGHLTVAADAAVLDRLARELVEGGSVRRR